MYYTGGIPTNPAPTVGITSPAGNSGFTNPANITITADAADANGTVTQVDFYNGTTLLDSDATAPYSFTWNNARSDTDILIANSTDNFGATTASSNVLVFVSAAGNLAPSASITTPGDNAAFLSPANLSITTSVTDGDNGIYKVDFFKYTSTTPCPSKPLRI
ncbi:MAG: Ig-like domain-containing protein [Chitinophagaceae bacterium]